MKRIAALAALMITMLAIPTAAMASTGSSGSGYGRPQPAQVVCLPPYRFHQGQVKITADLKAYLKRHKHGKSVRVRTVCPNLPAKPFPNGCRPQVLKFDMASGSGTLTEVSGPVLAPPEEFSYDGQTYTIMSVNPGADSFTVFGNGWLFVNKGAAITDGIGFMACSG